MSGKCWTLRPDLIVNSHLNSGPVLSYVRVSVSMSTFEMFSKYIQIKFSFLNLHRTDTSSGDPPLWEWNWAGARSCYKSQHPWTGHCSCIDLTGRSPLESFLVLGTKPEEPGDVGTSLTLAVLNQATHLLTMLKVKRGKSLSFKLCDLAVRRQEWSQGFVHEASMTKHYLRSDTTEM